MKPIDKFWETKSLSELTHDEWESLCDGCGKCCLTQLQDENIEQLVFTDVACDLFDDTICRCTDYKNRSVRVPTCLTMDRYNVEKIAEFAPPTCSYRLLVEAKPLPHWHHLICGDKSKVHESGNSVRHRVRFERDIQPQDIHDYLVNWP